MILKRTAGLPKREFKNMEVETEYLVYYARDAERLFFNQLRRSIQTASSEKDIVLDFFLGIGTTCFGKAKTKKEIRSHPPPNIFISFTWLFFYSFLIVDNDLLDFADFSKSD